MRITKENGKKRGLVLSGGGAKSIFQAQVVKRLQQEGYSFDIISGVSAGSLNAAIMSQMNGDIVELWSKVDKNDLFEGGPGFPGSCCHVEDAVTVFQEFIDRFLLVSPSVGTGHLLRF